MRIRELTELVEAWAAQTPGDWAGFPVELASVDAAAGGLGDWTLSVPADAGVLELAARARGTARRWDASAGRAAREPVRVETRRAPLSRARFASRELADGFRILSARCPIAAVETDFVDGRPTGTWRLRFARPEPFVRFLRLDAAAPFAPRAAELALLLAGREVAAMVWESERAWAELAP